MFYTKEQIDEIRRNVHFNVLAAISKEEAVEIKKNTNHKEKYNYSGKTNEEAIACFISWYKHNMREIGYFPIITDDNLENTAIELEELIEIILNYYKKNYTYDFFISNEEKLGTPFLRDETFYELTEFQKKCVLPATYARATISTLDTFSGNITVSKEGIIISSIEVLLPLGREAHFKFKREQLDVSEDFLGLNVLQAKLLCKAYLMRISEKCFEKIYEQYMIKCEFRRRFVKLISYVLSNPKNGEENSFEKAIAKKRSKIFEKEFNIALSIK